jgi:hypothetical protein
LRLLPLSVMQAKGGDLDLCCAGERQKSIFLSLCKGEKLLRKKGGRSKHTSLAH